jgi:hypothetical protein
VGAECPEHHADLVDGVTFNRQAAYNDNPAALLDFVEYLIEITVERRVPTVFRADFAKFQPPLAQA